MDFFRKRRRRKKCILRNGGDLLEEMITLFDGKSNPIRSFTAPVILKATNNFASDIRFDSDLYTWYKGIIEDRPVLVKRYYGRAKAELALKWIWRDIAMSSQMSSHKNVLKLLGICIEFPLPVLVCEYAEKGSLNRRAVLETGETLPLNLRLKIAKEVAHAVAYLHTALTKRFVHRDIKPQYIFLDKNWTVKFSDFSLSIPIPDGEPHIKTNITGTLGFLDPEYIRTSLAKESSDVYSLGVFLLVLITGKVAWDISRDHDFINIREFVVAAMEENLMIEIVDPGLVETVGDALKFQLIQLKASIDLALVCTSGNSEDRPSMIEVAKELGRIERSIKPSPSVSN